MYAPQGPPAVFSSVLASSVIIMSAVLRLLPPLGIPALGLCVIFPELLSDALFFGRFLLRLGFSFAIDLPLPCGEITVVLLHKLRSLVEHPHESLSVGIAVVLEDEACKKPSICIL